MCGASPIHKLKKKKRVWAGKEQGGDAVMSQVVKGFLWGNLLAPCIRRGENGEGYHNGAGGSIFYVLLMLLGFMMGEPRGKYSTCSKTVDLAWKSVCHWGKPAVDSSIYFALCRGISHVLKSLLCNNAYTFFAALNIISYDSECVFRGNESICCKFDHLHVVILVVKTINLKSLKIKKIILLIFFCFIFHFLVFFWFMFHFLVFFSLFLPTPQLFLWLCAWNGPEMV